MIYTGIGSRKTPSNILNIMIKLGRLFAFKNFTLRSGGANGADLAFERGCDICNGKKEIYLPWKNFNNNDSILFNITEEAIELARNYHPHWNKLSNGVKKLHARNCYQVLGMNLDNPTDFIVCWTEKSGGTQQALRIAKDYKIPIFNLINKNWNDDIINFLDKDIFFN